MKLSSYILVVLAIGLCFALVGNVVNDFETYYPDINVDTAWEDEYNYVEELNDSVSLVINGFNKIKDTKLGWFSEVTATIVAIPLAIIVLPGVIFSTLKYTGIIFTSVANEIGIPDYVIWFGSVAIIVVITFSLISFWHRWKT